jgi:4-amino-4-deoxy-L-arabinose transferase-like glycosyltransferase
MNAIRFVLAHYFALGLLSLLCYLWGRQLTRHIGYKSWWEQASFSIGLGLGLVAYLVFFLGLLGLLYAWLLLTLLVIGSLLCFPIWRTWPQSLVLTWERIKVREKKTYIWAAGGGALVLALSIPILLLPLYPPTAWDGGSYHLASAKIYLQNHGLVPTPYLRYVVFPQTNNMLFALALLLYDDILAHLIQFLIMLTTCLALVACGQRYFSGRIGWWAAALLLSSPLVLWLGSVAYIDLGVTLFVTLTVYAFWNWYQTREQRWLILAGLFGGFAAGTKYQAIFILGMLGLVTLYLSLRERKYLPPLVFGSIAGLIALPWFARNFYYTHNPIFPLFPDLFGRWFGYALWKPEHYSGMLGFESFYGVGKSFQALLMLPYNLMTRQEAFGEAPYISSLYVWLPLLGIIVCITTPHIRGILALALAYLLFWFYSVQAMRFLVPALPLLSLISAVVLDRSLLWLPFVRNWSGNRILTVAMVLLLLTPGWLYASNTVRVRGPIPATQEQRDTYLTQLLPSYPVFRFLNQVKGKNYKLYAVRDENMAYFVDGFHMGDWFGPARYSLIWDKLNNGELLYQEVKKLGVDYVSFNIPRLSTPLLQDESFKKHFKLIYANGGTSLFELTDKAVSLSEIALLQNPSFEDLENGWPKSWSHHGNPQIDTSSRNSHTGKVGVRCLGSDNTLAQLVRVEPGTLHRLSYYARAFEPGQTARLQVNWSNNQGKFLSASIELVKISADWKHYESVVSAPPQATQAFIYASSHERSTVWFDDFSFVALQHQVAP